MAMFVRAIPSRLRQRLALAGAGSFDPKLDSDRGVQPSRVHRNQGLVPSGYVKIAIENGPFIVDFPIKHDDFP